MQGERALFLESHRNCFAWIDEWFGMSMQQIRELELQSDFSLNKVGIPLNSQSQNFNTNCSQRC